MPYRAPGEGGSLWVIRCCVDTIYRRIMLYKPKYRKKNIVSDDITFITLYRLKKVYETNLNNNPRNLSGKRIFQNDGRVHIL